VLFGCAGNVARSPVAAVVFRDLAGREGRYVIRSAGTAPGARRRLTTRAVLEADVIVVMDTGQAAWIRRDWPDPLGKVRVLRVPDDYDPGEVALRARLEPRLRALAAEREGRGVTG
jgi:protein-tyrosine-phosphatase